MAEYILYIAQSLNGYIADQEGSVEWLHEQPNTDNNDYGYAAFLEDIDIVIMGSKTYESIIGFGVDWPYASCKTYIATRKKDYGIESPDTHLLPEIDRQTIQQIREESEKNIWLVGGGQLLASFLDHDAVDKMILFVFPLLLGQGIPLISGINRKKSFDLIDTTAYDTGIVKLVYRKKS